MSFYISVIVSCCLRGE